VIPVPEQFVVQKFYECVSHPSYNKLAKTYQGSCPFCKEGSSFGKKRRLFYIPKDEYAFCHNCGYSKKAFGFLCDLTGLPFNMLIAEIKKGTNEIVPVKTEEPKVLVVNKSLPDDCINLSDKNQLVFHKDNKIVKICMELIKKRRLDTAINKPKTFYLSLTDKTHKNRLILPFYDVNGDIIFYQSRTLLPEDDRLKPRYLSKRGGDRSLYGIHNVDSSLEHVFIFEGPIDSYFIKNGLAVCGITEDGTKIFTDLQQQQINILPTYTKIWCLDNQWKDNASLKKSFSLTETNDKMFIWPEELKKYKDINEYCVSNNLDQVDPKFIIDNSFSGLKAKIILTKIKNSISY